MSFLLIFHQVLLWSFRITSEGKVSQLCSSNWHTNITNLGADLPKIWWRFHEHVFHFDTNMFQLAWNHEIANLDVSRCIFPPKIRRIFQSAMWPEGTFFRMTSSNTFAKAVRLPRGFKLFWRGDAQIDEVNDVSFTKRMEDRDGMISIIY